MLSLFVLTSVLALYKRSSNQRQILIERLERFTDVNISNGLTLLLGLKKVPQYSIV